MQLSGWDSLETVSRLHGILEVAGIAFLALLVLAEAFAHVYGNRAVALAEIEKREAQDRLAKIEEKIAPRILTAAKREGIVSTLSPLGKNQQLDLYTFPGDPESAALAAQLHDTLSSVGWDVESFGNLGGGLAAILVEYLPQDDEATKRAQALASALTACGLIVNGPEPSLKPHNHEAMVFLAADDGRRAPVASIRLTVGKK